MGVVSKISSTLRAPSIPSPLPKQKILYETLLVEPLKKDLGHLLYIQGTSVLDIKIAGHYSCVLNMSVLNRTLLYRCPK